MATFFPQEGPAQPIATPLTLTKLQKLVKGFIKFIDTPSGDILVVNESAPEFARINVTASSLAGKASPVYGDVVLCDPSEIA
jgi:hypothetical protein